MGDKKWSVFYLRNCQLALYIVHLINMNIWVKHTSTAASLSFSYLIWYISQILWWWIVLLNITCHKYWLYCTYRIRTVYNINFVHITKRDVIFLMKCLGISLACVQIFTKYTPYLSIFNYLCVGCSKKLGIWYITYSSGHPTSLYTCIYGLYFEICWSTL